LLEEHEFAFRPLVREDAVHSQGVEMEVGVHCGTKMLEKSNGPRQHPRVAVLARGAPLPREERAYVEAEHPAEKLPVPRQEEADPPRERHDPLPEGYAGEDVVRQVKGYVMHPPRVARGAYPALAAKREKPLIPAIPAFQAYESPWEAPSSPETSKTPASGSYRAVADLLHPLPALW
jgi:hypothetical protein